MDEEIELKFISIEASDTPCSNCNGEVQEFSIPDKVWNKIIRNDGKETDNEYLCIWCFVARVVDWVQING